jgi:hypothetical protein
VSSDSKPKPLPSAAVINAYLEESAARTRMRLPIAKLVVPPAAPAESAQSANRPVQKSKALPTTRAGTAITPASPAISGKTSRDAAGTTPDEKSGAEAGWRPFGADEES